MLTLRYALRTLTKSPGFALTAILTLATGIGASTAIFTTVDAVLLHPLGYHDPAQLDLITKNMPKFELFKSDHSALDFIDYRNFSHSFSSMAGMQTNSVNLAGRAIRSGSSDCAFLPACSRGWACSPARRAAHVDPMTALRHE